MLKGICFVALFSTAIWAQSGNGSIKGSVADGTGAVIANAKVSLLNTDTNVRRDAVTSSVGLYLFAEIPPGPYTLTVENAGFRRWTGTLQLQVGQTATIDTTLEVGNLESVVEVNGVAPVITT